MDVHLFATSNSAKWTRVLLVIKNGTKSKGIRGSPAKWEKVRLEEAGVGVAFGGGGELAVAAGVGCEEEAVDGLGMDVRMTWEDLGLGVEG